MPTPSSSLLCVADQSGHHRPGSVEGLCFVVFSHVEFCLCQFVWQTAWNRWKPVLRLFTVPSVGFNSGADARKTAILSGVTCKPVTSTRQSEEIFVNVINPLIGYLGSFHGDVLKRH